MKKKMDISSSLPSSDSVTSSNSAYQDQQVSRRTKIAFWILGLCNNYGYVVMLSAATDIIARVQNSDTSEPDDPVNPRHCQEMSAGAILLADILPSLFIKSLSPFFPLYIYTRLVLMTIFSIVGFVMVAAATTKVLALTGVVCIAISSGLGEASLLAYMGLYQSIDVISTWSSGTGGAGIFGALTYAGFSLIFDRDHRNLPLYIMLIVPISMALCFIFLLEKPRITIRSATDEDSQISNGSPENLEQSQFKIFLHSLFWKLKLIPSLFKYMIPLCLVYLFEYFINQGLVELIQFPTTWLDAKDQYQWYQVDYQIGVFISRSSIKLVQINKIWLLALLQGLNVIFFTTDAIYWYVPNIFIIFAVIFFEGFLGGAAYVNTYNRVSHEVPEDKREFSMGITSIADAIGIAAAGFIAIKTHNTICNMPVP